MRKDYLRTNAFPNLVVVEYVEYLYALQKKDIEGKVIYNVIKETAG